MEGKERCVRRMEAIDQMLSDATDATRGVSNDMSFIPAQVRSLSPCLWNFYCVRVRDVCAINTQDKGEQNHGKKHILEDKLCEDGHGHLWRQMWNLRIVMHQIYSSRR